MLQPPGNIILRIESLLQAGKKSEARDLLVDYLRFNPNSARAWWLMSRAVTDPAQEKDCLERLLRLDPANITARERLETLVDVGTASPAWAASPPPPGSVEAGMPAVAPSRLSPAATDKSEAPTAPPSDELAEIAAGISPKKKRSRSSCLLEGLLVGAILLVSAVVVYFAISRGLLNLPAAPLPTLTVTLTNTFVPPTALPTATLGPQPSRTPTRTGRPTWTPYDTYTPIASPTTVQGAIEHWGELISQDSHNPDPYYQRAAAYYVSATAGNKGVDLAQLDLALKDIDKAIFLAAGMGDYYSLREKIYRQLVYNVSEYEADREYLAQMAFDNANKAYELGTTVDDHPELAIVMDLILTNKCQTAIYEVEKRISKLSAEDAALGNLLLAQSQAYACLGKLEEALTSVGESMAYATDMGLKDGLKARYLIMRGRYDEALPLLDQLINEDPSEGVNYFLRAQVYFNTGKKALVQAELEAGSSKTKLQGAWLAYAQGQLALDEGKNLAAIDPLQLAEATFLPWENPVRWKLQVLLDSLGAKVLKLNPSVTYRATPIP
jgi:tetratricopeptide (TPR) repeat protein